MRTKPVEIDDYDDANSRLCCAESIITALSICIDSDDGAPSNQVVSMALHGAGLLIEDARRRLDMA